MIAPRRALATAGERQNAGRSGSDLLAALVLVLVATRLRALVEAVWLGGAAGIGVGARAFARVLEPLTIPLAVLLIAASAIFAVAGRRRELGRAFDLACVAVLPIVVVVLVAAVLARAFDVAVPELAASLVAYGWTGVLVALAIAQARRGAVPAHVRHARAAGGALAAVACVGITLQAVWIARHPDAVRPMTSGKPAPALALPAIGPGGALGAKVALVPRKITVIDFWATWCGPCLRSLPRLDAFARRHPDVAVIAVLFQDDPAAGRELFDEQRYTPQLVADDGETSERYGVMSIPHTVVIDREGNVANVGGGGELDLEQELASLQK